MKKWLLRKRELLLKMLYLAGVMTMTRRARVLVGLVGVCLLAYVVFVTGIFSSDQIKIVSHFKVEYAPAAGRGGRPAPRTAAEPPMEVHSVFFALNKPCPLTSIRVYALSDLEKDGDAAKPMWALVTMKPEDPAKIDGFRYGGRVNGMKPAAGDRPRPEPLLPDTPYRLMVEAGEARGRLDFRTEAEAAPSP